MTPLIIPLYKEELKKYRRKLAAVMDEQFKEALICLLAALKAGYSIENAFIEAQKDMEYRFGK